MQNTLFSREMSLCILKFQKQWEGCLQPAWEETARHKWPLRGMLAGAGGDRGGPEGPIVRGTICRNGRQQLKLSSGQSEQKRKKMAVICIT